MITVQLLGGMGNQIFQRAFGLALEARGRSVLFSRENLIEGTHREYSLTAFEVDTPFANPPVGALIYEKGMPFNPEMLEPPEPSILYGYWQSEKYFADISDRVRKAFHFHHEVLTEKAQDIAKEIIDSENSVSVHVRRGDYLTLQEFHGMQSIDYYVEALKHMDFPKKVFVFSDDREWCQETLQPLIGGEVVSGTNKYDDLWLMSQCQHAVIVNSSFSWWGAWLSPFEQTAGRIVVAPKKWFATNTVDSKDIAPERWLRI